ncbi:nucleotidyltransferase domain-containing protein [Actinacidiphila oryziradicis]|uniref:Nucleotidyltransferase domain-containing protein n=1 Tax=Actinacidiphila oryziradicis TaxID=2571141 RepID=A0A4U0SLB6_9ACTN|nr:nucleotidyltransferase domain-containing protein [Actinacidiphila oryziradicis]TKA10492.1 nucleotidyltransferase domain-containing protein [Actinacidiphila oryziradicis]
MTLEEEFAAFQTRMEKNAEVLGVVLSGSQAREGMATAHSDYDLLLVVADGAEEALAGEARRDTRMDVSAMPLGEFRGHALPGSGTEWNRYAFTHAKLLKDTPEALIAGLVTAKGRLSPAEAAETAPEVLDGFLNSLYRCLKNERDGNIHGERLDAAEALPFYLTYVFALHGRVRPYNKYLSWELRHRPLGRPEWAHDHLLGLLAEALTPTAVRAVRIMFNEVEPHARAAGHGSVLDAWGEDLIFMRGNSGDSQSSQETSEALPPQVPSAPSCRDLGGPGSGGAAGRPDPPTRSLS